MHQLPEPPAAPTAGQTVPLSDAIVAAAVEKAIEDARQHDTAPHAVIGTAPPVAQPDSRIVPQWAAGLAVASIGVGAGSTGLGCAAWLLFKGLSLVSVPGLERFALIVIAPFAGLAMLVTAIGCAISKAGRAATPVVHQHTYNATVQQDQRKQESKTTGLWARTDNRQ